jgi:CheY-like chemotaxis protein
VSPPKTGAQARSDTRPAEAASDRLLIIDSDESWAAVNLDKQKVTIVTPDDDQVVRLGSSFQGSILLNLAMPGALATLATLREAGVTAGFQAYIAPPGTGRALKLGMIETTVSPMDPEVILTVLEGWVTGGTRLLTAAADADAVMSLRQALSRQGVSVSMAWDGSQARDLLTIIRPEVVVIDLDLPPRDGYGLVAELADLNPAPRAVLIPARSDGAARFAAEAADRSRAARLVALHQLVADLSKIRPTS